MKPPIGVDIAGWRVADLKLVQLKELTNLQTRYLEKNADHRRRAETSRGDVWVAGTRAGDQERLPVLLIRCYAEKIAERIIR